MVGCMSATLGGLALSSITRPLGFYLFMVIGCLQGIASIGVRAFITQFIPRNEISRLFSIIMTFEMVQPFIGSLIYSNIFAYSIDFYPTLAFHVTSLILIIGLVILTRMDMYWGDIKSLPRKNSVIIGFNADEEGNGGSRFKTGYDIQ